MSKARLCVDDEWWPVDPGDPPSGGEDPPPPPPPSLAWRWDCEAGFTATAGTVGRQTTPGPNGPDISIVTSSPLQGSRSVRVLANSVDEAGAYGSGAGFRTELNFSSPALTPTVGTTQWYGWKIKPISGDWTTWPGYLCVTQFHAGGSGASPVVATLAEDGFWQFVRRGGGDGSKTHPNYSQHIHTTSVPFTNGRTYDIKVMVTWSEGSGGRVRGFIDGVQVFNSSGPTKYAGRGPYWKAGVYGGAASSGNKTWVIEFDSFCRATGATAEADIDAQLAQP